MKPLARTARLLAFAALAFVAFWAIGQASLPSVPPALGEAIQTRNAPITTTITTPAPVFVPLASILSTIPGIGTITNVQQSQTHILIDVLPASTNLLPLANAVRASILAGDPTTTLAIIVAFTPSAADNACIAYSSAPSTAAAWTIDELPCSAPTLTP